MSRRSSTREAVDEMFQVTGKGNDVTVAMGRRRVMRRLKCRGSNSDDANTIGRGRPRLRDGLGSAQEPQLLAKDWAPMPNQAR